MSVPTETLLQAPILAGALVRSGKDADRIDGVRPRLVVEPRTAEEVAALLAWASRERLTLVLRGGGTKLGWGRVPAPIDLLVSMRGLNRMLAHEHADLTATVEAGATLEELNASLGRHRQWLPLDPAGDEATVGGAIATNDTGPLRHRYGTPRDLLIGVRLATTDGRLVKAGGNVVKNVAVYDLGKLVSGSFGSLAAIVGATFKLLPVPASSQTLSATFQDRDRAAAAVARLTESQLEPAAVELQAAHDRGRGTMAYRLLARFATSPAAAAAQVEQARALVGGGEAIMGDAEVALWRRYQRRASASAGTVLRMSWLPAALPQVLALVEEVGRTDGSVELVARAGVGTGLLRVDGASDWQAATVERVRARAEIVTYATIQDAPPEVKTKVDAWGPPGAADTVASAIKRALDPAGILNAGRGPV
ncbi:MAG: FAD-binding oxidoreductase [Acidobacteria bacterium]|nr:FAD-binding oxidoreductase [Acidobacteriota bacterium]